MLITICLKAILSSPRLSKVHKLRNMTKHVMKLVSSFNIEKEIIVSATTLRPIVSEFCV